MQYPWKHCTLLLQSHYIPCMSRFQANKFTKIELLYTSDEQQQQQQQQQQQHYTCVLTYIGLY